MPRGTSAHTKTAARGRRRTTRVGSDTVAVVGQITQLVTANETLRRENAELLAVNEQLRAHLQEIGSALGSLSNGSRRRGRGAAQPFVLAEAPGCEYPLIVTPSVLAGSAVAGTIVCTPPPVMLKAIVSGPGLALASRIACRSDPTPLSAVVVTV